MNETIQHVNRELVNMIKHNWVREISVTRELCPFRRPCWDWNISLPWDPEAVVSGATDWSTLPAVLITYSCDPGTGSGCISKCSVHSTSVGAFVNGWRGCVPWWLMVYIGEWAAEWSHLKCLQSVRSRLRFRYPTSSGRNWMATRCPQTMDLRMATWWGLEKWWLVSSRPFQISQWIL